MSLTRLLHLGVAVLARKRNVLFIQLEHFQQGIALSARFEQQTNEDSADGAPHDRAYGQPFGQTDLMVYCVLALI